MIILYYEKRLTLEVGEPGKAKSGLQALAFKSFLKDSTRGGFHCFTVIFEFWGKQWIRIARPTEFERR